MFYQNISVMKTRVRFEITHSVEHMLIRIRLAMESFSRTNQNKLQQQLRHTYILKLLSLLLGWYKVSKERFSR